jgi:hypothetical protein
MIISTDGLLATGNRRRIRPLPRQGQCELSGLALLMALSLATATPAVADWHERAIDLMGTRVAVEFWHEDAAAAEVLLERVL